MGQTQPGLEGELFNSGRNDPAKMLIESITISGTGSDFAGNTATATEDVWCR